MEIVTDEDVPDSVARFLASRGHDVRSVREVFMASAEDPVIAAGVSEQKALLVTFNKRHFRNLAKRKDPGGGLKYPGMSLLVFNLHHSEGLARLEQVIEEFESSYTLRVQNRGVRLIFEVGKQVIRIED